MNSALCVCIPWRPHPSRLAAAERVRKFWADYPVIWADSDPSLPFSLACARNRAVAAANADVVIVADADTICEPQKVAEAIGIAAEHRVVVWPFNRYRVMGPGAELVAANKLPALTPLFTKFNAAAGIYVTTSKLYWSLGGNDERFLPTWGFEDRAFMLAAQTLAGTLHMTGIAWTFDHDPWDNRDPTPQRPHYALYQNAAGHPDAMRQLVAR